MGSIKLMVLIIMVSLDALAGSEEGTKEKLLS